MASRSVSVAMDAKLGFVPAPSRGASCRPISAHRNLSDRSRNAGLRTALRGRSRAVQVFALRPYLEKLVAREDLSAEEAEKALDEALDDEASSEELAAFLALLAAKGENPEEIAALADCMLKRMVPVRVDESLDVLDIVGTGGDGAHTINVCPRRRALLLHHVEYAWRNMEIDRRARCADQQTFSNRSASS